VVQKEKEAEKQQNASILKTVHENSGTTERGIYIWTSCLIYAEYVQMASSGAPTELDILWYVEYSITLNLISCYFCSYSKYPCKL